MTNLIGNAIKFTEIGSVEVSLSSIEKTADQATLQFSVLDTGIGISAELLPTIFEPFSRDEQSRKKIYEGTGLGLSIVKNLVKTMSGTIQIESKPGVGSRFCVEIPFFLNPNEHPGCSE
jgi:signal transduction histidine kinase